LICCHESRIRIARASLKFLFLANHNPGGCHVRSLRAENWSAANGSFVFAGRPGGLGIHLAHQMNTQIVQASEGAKKRTQKAICGSLLSARLL
jgi:hypothetical protein